MAAYVDRVSTFRELLEVVVLRTEAHRDLEPGLVDKQQAVAAWLEALTPVLDDGGVPRLFGSFVTSDVLEMKQIGFGLAAAVLIDATLVRIVLVPAVMRLASNANWWLPAWLDRRLPHIDA